VRDAIRTNSENPDFQKLVAQLDAELKIRNGESDVFYSQYNKTDSIKYAVVVYENEEAVGCGAIKKFSDDAMEVKRMFVPEAKRGKGIAIKVLGELEKWTLDLGFNKCILETGLTNPEAISLYKKSGYKIIPNYGQYENVKNSVCFQKEI
jgi:putative acetyltransferase